jgi:DNA-binding SARP family transcriptional activator
MPLLEEAAGASPGPEAARDTLSLLDAFTLVRNGQSLSIPTGGQRLLALLALRGHFHRAVTAGLLWPDVAEEHAQGRLRTALWRLHRLWPGLVKTADHHIALDEDVEVDTARFVAHALRVVDGAAPLSGDRHCLGALAAQELLPGWYDDWVVFERERLRQLRMHALERLSDQLVDRRAFGLALEAALEAVRMEPLRESAHCAVLAVHLAEGNVVEARRHYAALRRLLSDELDVEPSPAVRALVGAGARTPFVPARRVPL